MKLLSISSNRFINPAHIVELEYTPADVRTTKKRAKSGWTDIKTATVETTSSIKITLTVGSHTFSGAEADRIYNELLKLGN